VTPRRSLSHRLFVSYLLVVAVGAAALFITARFVGPALFDTEIEQIGQRFGWNQTTSAGGGGPGGRGQGDQGDAAVEAELRDAFAGSLTLALVVAVAAGVIAAAVGAAVVSGRVVRPLNRVRTAVRRMAAGDYRERVEEPADAELADLARDVNALGTALDDSEQRRARLVSDLAHELRTPITSIDGYLEGLEDGVFAATPATLGAMREEAGRLRRLATDLSALSRADEQAFDLEPADLDLGEVVVAAARSLAPRFSEKGVDLVTDSLPGLPVRVDADRMTQVITNLLRNALEHTPVGGVVTIAGVHQGNRVAVTVMDSGPGIDPEHLPHLFERFYRVDAPEGSIGGTGIGLTIARSITRAHGGEVTASSPGPGRGASFTVTVPARG